MSICVLMLLTCYYFYLHFLKKSCVVCTYLLASCLVLDINTRNQRQMRDWCEDVWVWKRLLYLEFPAMCLQSSCETICLWLSDTVCCCHAGSSEVPDPNTEGTHATIFDVRNTSRLPLLPPCTQYLTVSVMFGGEVSVRYVVNRCELYTQVTSSRTSPFAVWSVKVCFFYILVTKCTNNIVTTGIIFLFTCLPVIN